MKKNIKTLAIIFSVVLNIVFIRSHFYHKSDLCFLTNHQANHNRFLYEELTLSPEQLDKFEPIRDRFHNFLSQQGKRIKVKQLELINLLARETPDHRAIDAKKEEIQALQRQMQTKVIDHLLEESSLFTPEQREKFFNIIKGRIEKGESPHPQWMPQTQVNPSEEGHP